MTAGGIVLCGGRSSRMGRPKAWLPFGGEPMLRRVVHVLCEAVDPVVVVAAPGQAVPPLPPGVAVVRDEVEGRGPLAGLAAGLTALEGRADAAYLSSCDAPFLRPAFVRQVVASLSGGREPPEGPYAQGAHAPRSGEAVIAVPRVGGRLHPLAAAYRLSVRPAVRGLLAADRRRLALLFDAVPTRVLGPDDLAAADPDFRSLRNLNTPDEYAAALRDLARPYNTPPSE